MSELVRVVDVIEQDYATLAERTVAHLVVEAAGGIRIVPLVPNAVEVVQMLVLAHALPIGDRWVGPAEGALYLEHLHEHLRGPFLRASPPVARARAQIESAPPPPGSG